MPKLKQYIGVGFCSGYGDGDFGVSASVSNLSRKEMDELKLTTLTALRVADDMWRSSQPTEQACASESTSETNN